MWLDERPPKTPETHEELIDSMPKAPWNNNKNKSKIKVE
jgi:hypothetical protein